VKLDAARQEKTISLPKVISALRLCSNDHPRMPNNTKSKADTTDGPGAGRIIEAPKIELDENGHTPAQAVAAAYKLAEKQRNQDKKQPTSQKGFGARDIKDSTKERIEIK